MTKQDLLEIARYALKTGDESVTEQYEEVQSIRLRASFLITVNALSSTLFSQFLGKPFETDILLAGAVIFFVACNVFALLVMMPNGTWRITKSAGRIVEDFIDNNPGLSAGQVFGILAIKTDEDQIRNERIVASAHSTFLFAVCTFAASTVCWLLHLGFPLLAMGGLTLD